MMPHAARTIAAAQLGLSAVYIGGYFAMLSLFLWGEIHTPPEWRDQLGILIGVLTAGVSLILQFWFARSRAKDPDDEPPC